ncbi:ABC transporter related [Candidatus Vecturithrix granuli]|uniref:ABC transporter related n=1 Tax=Vecturithrix granuli TaxID=1499967 RepID=A0A081C4R0_VECG1|nr:ABC transporter related [Candidatus Vecturithrix granuli]
MKRFFTGLEMFRKSDRAVRTQTSESSNFPMEGFEFTILLNDDQLSFGKVLAFDGANFRVDRNEIVGLLGENGADKTTLVNTLIGIYKSFSGEIYFDGKKANFRSPTMLDWLE